MAICPGAARSQLRSGLHDKCASPWCGLHGKLFGGVGDVGRIACSVERLLTRGLSLYREGVARQAGIASRSLRLTMSNDHEKRQRPLFLQESPIFDFRASAGSLLLPLRELPSCGGLCFCGMGNSGYRRIQYTGWALKHRELIERCLARFLRRVWLVADVSECIAFRRNRFHVGIAGRFLAVRATGAHLGGGQAAMGQHQ